MPILSAEDDLMSWQFAAWCCRRSGMLAIWMPHWLLAIEWRQAYPLSKGRWLAMKYLPWRLP